MRLHRLKTWPPYFADSMFGNKSFELRINDRDYKVGDYIVLEEWDPKTEEYTGQSLMRHVTYILKESFGLPENMVVMAVVRV